MFIVDASLPLSETAFHVVRFLMGSLILVCLILAVRWGCKSFLGSQAKERTDRQRRRYFAAYVLVLVALLLLKRPLEFLIGKIAGLVIQLLPFIDPAWPAAALTAVLYAAIAYIVLLLVIQLIGIVYWEIDSRIEAWRLLRRKDSPEGRITREDQIAWTTRLFLRGARTVTVTLMLLFFFPYVVRLFPRTRSIANQMLFDLRPPVQRVAEQIVNYLPNLTYLVVIIALSWAFLKAMKWVFNAISDGTLVFDSFPTEWSDPTYKLFRTLFLIFVLMIAYPYLPGANSQFFKGFSLFLGALVTFGSTGAIGNMVSGIVLTYTRAFRVGEVVKIGETFGRVTQKSLLSTQIQTPKNEIVTFPNGHVLSGSVINYSEMAKSQGLAIAVTASIGYDTDWRIVDALMREGARRTEQIAQNPVPRVLETKFGDYFIAYELRAWINNPVGLEETYASLRRNVLDAFNEAGVEIMTPIIMAHRDASELAVPADKVPNRPPSKPLSIELIKRAVQQPNEAEITSSAGYGQL